MARRKKIGLIDLQGAIQEVLDEYGDDVYRVLGVATHDVCQDCVKKLKSVNKFSGRGHPTGKYSADWTVDPNPKKRTGAWQAYVVHNEKHYRLAHLLEKGHAIKDGTGREVGSAGAYEHIKPVEEWAQNELPQRIEKLINTL